MDKDWVKRELWVRAYIIFYLFMIYTVVSLFMSGALMFCHSDDNLRWISNRLGRIFGKGITNYGLISYETLEDAIGRFNPRKILAVMELAASCILCPLYIPAFMYIPQISRLLNSHQMLVANFSLAIPCLVFPQIIWQFELLGPKNNRKFNQYEEVVITALLSLILVYFISMVLNYLPVLVYSFAAALIYHKWKALIMIGHFYVMEFLNSDEKKYFEDTFSRARGLVFDHTLRHSKPYEAIRQWFAMSTLQKLKYGS